MILIPGFPLWAEIVQIAWIKTDRNSKWSEKSNNNCLNKHSGSGVRRWAKSTEALLRYSFWADDQHTQQRSPWKKLQLSWMNLNGFTLKTVRVCRTDPELSACAVQNFSSYCSLLSHETVLWARQITIWGTPQLQDIPAHTLLHFLLESF